MARRILERERELAELAAVAREAASGHGYVVLVSGEAGIGKSSLVDAARGLLPADGRILIGHCDDLATARVLGPFRDLIGSVGTQVSAALSDGADRDRILTALRAELDWPGHATVLAIEDVHWADDASLDVLRYLVRRVADLPVVLILTYRDSELGPDHPVRQLLGLATDSGHTRRLPLQRLSTEAVRELSSGSAIDADELHAVTSGNPFFVTEVLASGRDGVPLTVVDSVLARMSTLTPATREALEQLSVVPTSIDRWLVDALVVGGLPVLTEAEASGLLTLTTARISFWHELTRRAIVDALSPTRRVKLNEKVLFALIGRSDADVARIVHHATQAGDDGAIVRFGPIAARAAVAGGAHREAAAHYRLVLEHLDRFDREEQAALLEGYAVECYITGDSDQAVTAQQQAIELRRSLDDDAAVGAGLRWLSRMHWWNGDRAAAEVAAREAVAVVEPLAEPRLLALVYSNQAQLDMLGFRGGAAIAGGERAVALAREAGDPATLSHALNNLGSAHLQLGNPLGRTLLEDSLEVALRAGEIDHALRAYVNIAWTLLGRFQLDDAEPYIRAGAELAERAEHLGFVVYLHGLQAQLHFDRGQWDDALISAAAAAGMHGEVVNRSLAMTISGRVRVRRGDRSGEQLLSSAWELTHGMGELQWSGPAAAGLAEAAWLRGDETAIAGLVESDVARANRVDATLISSELGYWLSKAGQAVAVPGSDDPYGLLVAGRWREAAEFWRNAGCPYEQALALAEGPEPADLLRALELLDALDAKPLARIVRRQLQDLGVNRVPRGPAAATRHNPARLTQRQLEVLQLLGDGLSNAEIADRLVMSVRTAGNHVAAVLDKLGVHNRKDAAIAARELLADGDKSSPDRSE